MHVRTYIYDSDSVDATVNAILDRLEDRPELIEIQDVAVADDRRAALRLAMLTVRESIRIGSNPDELYDADGTLDFSAGVLITQEPTGRREVYIGDDALAVLEHAGS